MRYNWHIILHIFYSIKNMLVIIPWFTPTLTTKFIFIKQTWLWKLPGILSGQLLSPRMRDKTKGCIWSSVRATKEAVLTQQGCVCVTCLLEAAFCPVPKMTLSYIKALRRGIRCPSMLKTTFSFLGTRKSLFEKGPSTQISAFWSTAQENYRVQNFSFENGNIPEAFL